MIRRTKVLEVRGGGEVAISRWSPRSRTTRACSIRRMVSQGAGDLDAHHSVLLGHSHVRNTETYTHVQSRMKRKPWPLIFLRAAGTTGLAVWHSRARGFEHPATFPQAGHQSAGRGRSLCRVHRLQVLHHQFDDGSELDLPHRGSHGRNALPSALQPIKLY